MTMYLPYGLTMGDPAGIGPEITVKLAAGSAVDVPLVVFGDPDVLAQTAETLNVNLAVREIADPSEVTATPATLHVIACADLPKHLPIGVVSAEAGRAAYEYIVRAITEASKKAIAGIVTAPINKEALRAAGLPFPGHTEILAHHSGTADYTMMMAAPDLRVVLVTIHESLRLAIDHIDRTSVARVIRLAHRALNRQTARPRIAVAGLNPHAGENGLMGTEELEIIGPAVADARDEGIDVQGPLPPDTVFMRARDGEFDVVVAQYHDQGLIPFKFLGLDRGVNVTLGLPFVRTSVDHGTAFAIAGKGIADHSSLRLALEQAIELTGNR